jgi:hypothetical protein
MGVQMRGAIEKWRERGRSELEDGGQGAGAESRHSQDDTKRVLVSSELTWKWSWGGSLLRETIPHIFSLPELEYISLHIAGFVDVGSVLHMKYWI